MSSAQDIWNALIAAGASPIQAAGIMGNMFFESSLNPEANAVDSNGYRSYGLIQWNSAPGNYPNASSLVTGNPQKDTASQITFLAQTGGFRAASGSTASEAGGNFAANYERCASCQSGGNQYNMRASKAADFFASAQSGNWATSSGNSGSSGTQTAGNVTGASYDPATCLVGFNQSLGGLFSLVPGGPSSINACFFTKTEARALIGGLILGVSAVLFIAGSVILVSYGFRRSGAATAVGSSLSAVTGPTRMLGSVVKRSATRSSSPVKENDENDEVDE